MLINFDIFQGSLKSVNLDAVRVINTINSHSYCVSKKDKEFQIALKDSNILLPDGLGVVWAERVLNGNKISKIAGYDLFVFLMERANTLHQKVFFL